MKTALPLTIFVLILCLSAVAQQVPSSPAVERESAAAPQELDAILADLQQWTQSAAHDLESLRIERWKTDSTQKSQMQKAITSLQRNLATIMPGPARDLRRTPGSASKAFKLYSNVNLVYEFLGSVTDAAGSFGRPEEYDPLAGETASLDKLRHRLSQYAEESAATLEASLQEAKAEEVRLQASVEAAQAAQAAAMRKLVVDDPAVAKKPKRAPKKISAVVSPAPSAQ